MNDPVIDRIAREDPAAGNPPGAADQMLARVLHEIALVDSESAPVPVVRRLGRVAAPAVAVLVTLAVMIAAIELLRHTSSRSTSAARPARPVSVVSVGEVQVAPGAETLLAQGGSLWVAGAHWLERRSSINGAVEAKIRLPIEGLADGLAFGAGSVWVAAGGGNTGSAPSLVRVNPADNRILATINVAESSARGVHVLNRGIAFAAGRVWLSRDAMSSHGDVVSVNPETNHLDGGPVGVGTGPTTLLAAFGALWVDNTGLALGPKPEAAQPASIDRIDPRTRQVTTERFSGAPSAGFGSLWIQDQNTITRYDPSTGRAIARIHIPGVIAIAVGRGHVWAVSGPVSTSNRAGSTAVLTQIDPRANRVVGRPGRISAAQPVAIAVSGHELWVADYRGELIHLRLTDR